MADDNVKIGQNEIEQLLRQAQATALPSSPAAPDLQLSPQLLKAELTQCGSSACYAPSSLDRTSAIDDVQFLLAQAEKTLSSIDQPENPLGGGEPVRTAAKNSRVRRHLQIKRR